MGVIYIYFEQGFKAVFPYVNGVVIGAVLGLLIAVLELFVFARGAKRIKFIFLLIVRTLFYLILITIIIFTSVVITQMIMNSSGYIETLNGSYIQSYLFGGRFLTAISYTLLLAFSVNFVRMISRKMGQGMLVSYIRGTYYSPVHETRIIMFVNIVDTKKILKKLESKKFHAFLSDLFYDLTPPVVSNRGIIYEYIEDLMVISWAMDKGLKDASCIRVFFDIQNTINAHKEKYLEKYGFVPHVQAGLHTGSVVRAEIGEVKTQIVFQGDTMNTTSRILDKCSEMGKGLLASDQLIRMIGLPRIYSKESVGKINLRGKEESMELFKIYDKVSD